MRLLYHPAKRLKIHFSKSWMVLHSCRRITPAVVPNPSPIRRRAIFSTARKGWIDEVRSSEEDSTIYALSTAPGRAAIAIVRISGPACIDIYKALCPGTPLPKPRHATLRSLYEPIRNPAKSAVLDSGALVLYFPAPKTVTGDDVLEFHIHGGPALVKAVLAAIPQCTQSSHNARIQTTTVRYAEPGEFTRRAFYNDRLDLTQIEALGDALSADTEQQRRLAVRGTTNALSGRYESWRQQLLYARGELEALIDFAEDQHFDESPANLISSVAEQVKPLKGQVQAHIVNASRGELVRSGIRIALLGAPNAGKSSLLNQIVGREAAIVSKEEGTTRDVVEVGVDIGGFYCKFGDMAGLRREMTVSMDSSHSMSNGTIGEVEKEGIRRAKLRALDSDVVIVVLSVEPEAAISESFSVKIDAEVAVTAANCSRNGQAVIYAVNKVDQVRTEDLPHKLEAVKRHISKTGIDMVERLTPPTPRSYASADSIFAISCKDAGHLNSAVADAGGIQTLLKGLVGVFEEITAPVTSETQDGSIASPVPEESLGATERQRLLLVECLGHLSAFLSNAESAKQLSAEVEEDIDVVVAAENLRAAANCLAKITGKGEAGDVEEVLGVVFEK
ncbi:MAG: mitochondrial splicing system protein [Pleopsidium flavum]|nr:MAG: mitochondrial splicing system protein [Pleopsidium flavum]